MVYSNQFTKLVGDCQSTAESVRITSHTYYPTLYFPFVGIGTMVALVVDGYTPGSSPALCSEDGVNILLRAEAGDHCSAL